MEKSKTHVERVKNVLSLEEETEVKERMNLTRQAITKLVKDFHISLRTTLDRLGDMSNAEKHVNEMIHKANFRFSDLQTILARAKDEVLKGQKFGEILQKEVSELIEREKEEHPE